MKLGATSDVRSPLKSRLLCVPGRSLDEELDRLANDEILPNVPLPALLWVTAGIRAAVFSGASGAEARP